MEVNVMKSLQNPTSKIKGALYGFAIGDAMGATTEFMNPVEIKKAYGKVDNIIGGGWLNLEAGEVTDDTQMTLCVCEALEYGFGKNRQWSAHEHASKEDAMLDRCCSNFIDWYRTMPKDIGGCCSRVISGCIGTADHKTWQAFAHAPYSLGNGSLMRTMPIILACQSEDLAISQGRLTHNNTTCDIAISMYYMNIECCLKHNSLKNKASFLADPTGHVMHTLNNAVYWVQETTSLEEAIIGPVNNGGDADTIAAITGSLAGALYGYEAIPQRWVDQLKPEVKNELEKYLNFFENF